MVLLTTILRANARFSFVSGLLMTLCPGAWAALLGPAVPAAPVRWVGLAVLGFAIWAGFVSRTWPRAERHGHEIIWGDVAWVIASVALLVLWHEYLSITGLVLVLGAAAIAAGFAWMEHTAVRALTLPRCALLQD